MVELFNGFLKDVLSPPGSKCCVATDRGKCYDEFMDTHIKKTPYNWHIWKRAWMTSRSNFKCNCQANRI